MQIKVKMRSNTNIFMTFTLKISLRTKILTTFALKMYHGGRGSSPVWLRYTLCYHDFGVVKGKVSPITEDTVPPYPSILLSCMKGEAKLMKTWKIKVQQQRIASPLPA